MYDPNNLENLEIIKLLTRKVQIDLNLRTIIVQHLDLNILKQHKNEEKKDNGKII